MKLKNYLLSHNDLESFLFCPRLLYGFRPEQKTKSQIQDLLHRCVLRVFTSELVKEAFPQRNVVATYWSKQIKAAIDEGRIEADKKTVTDLMLLMHQAYDRIYEKLFKGGWRTIGARYPVSLITEKAIYQDYIPAVLFNGNAVYGLYFKNLNNYMDRDNFIRFTAAAFEAQTGRRLDGYVYVTIPESLRTVNIQFLKITEEANNRAANELKDLLITIGRDVDLPNTSVCNRCEFVNQCRL